MSNPRSKSSWFMDLSQGSTSVDTNNYKIPEGNLSFVSLFCDLSGNYFPRSTGVDINGDTEKLPGFCIVEYTLDYLLPIDPEIATSFIKLANDTKKISDHIISSSDQN